MKKFLRNFFIFFVTLVLIGKGMNMLFQGNQSSTSGDTEPKSDQKGGTSSFTFMGVGDNLIHEAIYYYWDEGKSFDSIYEPISQYTKDVDLAYINYETICAGEELGLSGYPTFNGPTEINDAVYNAGFDWLSMCSNHTMDRSSEGVFASLDYFKKHTPNMTITGVHTSKKDRNTPTVIEVNGIKVGLASYTYGLNGFELPKDMPWLVNLIDEDQIRKDLKELNKVSDVQIVSMHWGDEYQTQYNDFQKKYAKLLNELGVEVIVGTHPHVIEPVEWIRGENQDTLCYYSLGNFISEQDAPERMVGGMAGFTVEYDFDAEKATVKDATFTPTITYYKPNYTGIRGYTISQWTDEMSSSNFFAAQGEELSKEYVIEYVKEVIGNPKDVEVVLQ